MTKFGLCKVYWEGPCVSDSIDVYYNIKCNGLGIF
jgi:hypothetical protein